MFHTSTSLFAEADSSRPADSLSGSTHSNPALARPLVVPTLSSVSPASASVGGTVALNGTGLAGATSITFTGASFNTVTTGFVVNGAGTQITGIVVPGGATSGNVSVTTPGGTSNGIAFTLTATVPTTSSLSPNSAPANSLPFSMTVTGSGFTSGATVRFNGTPLSTTFVSTSQLTATVPSSSTATPGSYPVTVNTTGGNSSARTFTVTIPVNNAPAWQSAMAFSQASTADSRVDATATDASGNVYIAGGFNNSARFGTITLPGNGLFVAKWSPATGTFAWAQPISYTGPAGVAVISGIAVSGANAYVTGSFFATATFGSTTLTNTDATGNTYDVFVAKLADAGSTSSWSWAVRAGGTKSDGISAVAVSGANVYIAGSFRGAVADFGGTNLTNADNTGFTSDVFVARLTDAGSSAGFAWAKSAGDTSDDRAAGLAVNGTDVYVAGLYSSYTIVLGSITLTNFSTQNHLFVAKLSDTGGTGTYVWAQGSSNTGGCTAYGLALNGSSLYVAGSFTGTVGFGSSSITSTTGGGFVAKLTDAGSTGSFVWSQRFGANADVATAVAVQGVNVYATGYYTGTADFGNTFLTPTPSSISPDDVFVTKLIDAGSTSSFAWAQQAGGTRVDIGAALTVFGPYVYVGGRFQSDGMAFSSITLSNTNGNFFGFLAAIFDGLAPTLTSVSPTSGARGSTVVLNGTNLTGVTTIAFAGTPNNTVTTGFTVNGAGTQITGIVVPGGAQTGLVTVSMGGQPSNGVLFNVIVPVPALTSINPTSGTIGSTVVLNGTDLTGATTITFAGSSNNTVTTGFSVNGAGTQITGLVVPTGAITGNVTVTTPGGTSNGITFTVTVAQLAVSQSTTGYPSGGTAYGFGNQLLGSSSPAVAFTLTNAGTAPLTIASIVATGDFATSGPVPTGVAAGGGTGTVSAVFTPTSAGLRTGTLVITSNAGTYTLNVKGTGVVPVPVLTSLNPTSGPVGTGVVLNGTALTGATTVTFAGSSNNTVTTGFTVNGAGTQITGLVVPAGAITGNVTVTTPGGTSNGITFTVTAAQLAVSEATTSYASGGTPYSFASRLVGSSSPAVAFTLTNPGTAALAITSISASGDYAVSGPAPTTVAAGGTATVSVVFTPTAGGVRAGTLIIASNATNAGTYTLNLTGTGVVPAPILASLNPTSGPVGQAVTLTGTNLNNASSVSFNGTVVASAAFISNSATSLVVNVPAGATTGTVTVTTAGGMSNGVTFTVTPLAPGYCGPSVAGPGGTLSMINAFQSLTAPAGNRYYWPFVATAGVTYAFSCCNGSVGYSFANDTYLRVYNAAGSIVAQNDDFGPFCPTSHQASMYFTPPASGTYYLYLSQYLCNPLVNAVTLTYWAYSPPVPALTSIGPALGPVGSPVTLTGTGLTSAMVVSFSGSGTTAVTSGFAVNAAGTQITGILVPTGAATGPVTVTTPGGTSGGVNFTLTVPVSPPAIGSFSPPSGGAGAVVVISGGNYSRPAPSGTRGGPKARTASAPSVVRFNGVPTTFTVISPTQLSAIVPVGATSGPITVTSADGTAASLSNFDVDLTVSTTTSIAEGTYHDVTILGTGSAKLDGDVTVTGALLVQSGALLSDGCHRLLGSGSVTLAPGATLGLCDAQGLSNTAGTGTVQTSGARDFSPDARYLYNGTVAQLTGNALPATVRDLTIDNFTGVTLSASETVSATLAINAGTLSTASGKNLTLPNGSTLIAGTNLITGNGNFTLADGATLQTAHPAGISSGNTASGTVQNTGTTRSFGTGASYEYNGTAAQTTGTGLPAAVASLTVNNAAGTTLTNDLTTTGALTMTSGVLTTGARSITLGATGTLSEQEASYVLGKVVANRPLVPGSVEAFGGLGLTLTPANTSIAPGATLATRTTGTALAGAGTSQSILRNFTIQPTVNTGLSVTMDFAYFAHELNGIPVASLALFKSVSGGAPWAPQRGTTAGPNVVTKAGITDFSVWTLGNSANPLPVELTGFAATAEGPRAVRLAWATASEKNSATFDVERSADGRAFAAIGKVAAAGTSTTPRAYTMLDAQLPAGATTLYYRLRQVDRDSTLSYSPVRTITFSSNGSSALLLAPNPARTTMLAGAQAGGSVQVFDAVGRLVLTATAMADGTAQLVLPAALPTGIYFVRSGSKVARLAVE
ncbi:IPT/TIG domain-containing protein [Microvirga sp. STS02]|uniref:IPT/TIG domain-containing protein n=1 Tax=Hymenobacter negativus TaxID=2795026 RepID=UPI0018DB1F20|nr:MULTISPECIES: IPT/TIG domain-containing protein [Bacteria]MBH8571321.1 IPT/TIG domain-containing protein [Hymenobacter negativus]MBR7211059.1 IPT/TIG domain-containing protein [Microvirga sp. STS02]